MMNQFSRKMIAAMGVLGALSACDPLDSPGIRKFETPGPIQVRTVRVNGYTLFLGNGSGPKPGLTWAHASGGSPTLYQEILTRVAEFGTQVVASNSGSGQGSGHVAADGVAVLRSADSSVTTDFCTAGHAEGGSGSVNAARILTQQGTVSVRCTIPIQPDTIFTANSNGADLKGFALILCGGTDTLMPCNGNTHGDALFNQSQRPTTQVTVLGADQLAPTRGGIYSALLTAGIEAAIDGDPEARAALFGPKPTAAQDRRLTRVRTKGF